MITSQIDDGEEQVTVVTLPAGLMSGMSLVLDVESTITNAITDPDPDTSSSAITANPLKEFNFDFQLSDIPGGADLGAATWHWSPNK